MKVHTKIPEGRANITITVDDKIRAYLKYRADRLGWSLAMISEPIINEWISKGCPGLVLLDKQVPYLTYQQWLKEKPVVDPTAT